MKGELTLYVCGCRGSRSVFGSQFMEFGGQTTCFVLKKDDYALVLDCGTGLDNARALLADCAAVDVVITHWHYDHVMGLMNWDVFPTAAKLRFFVSSDAYNLSFDALSQLFRHPFWPVDPTLRVERKPVKWNNPVWLRPEVKVTFLAAPHPDGSSVLDLSVFGRHICLLCDFEHNTDFPEEILENCDLLLYDGMYTDEEYPEHINWGHSTWQEGCRLANRAGVDRLMIIHHEPGRTDVQLREMEKEAKKLFPSSVFARAGMKINV